MRVPRLASAGGHSVGNAAAVLPAFRVAYHPDDAHIFNPPPRKRGAIRFQSVFGKRAAPNKTRASVRKTRTKEKTD